MCSVGHPRRARIVGKPVRKIANIRELVKRRRSTQGVSGRRESLAGKHFGDVAQLGERLVCNQEVAGSIPVVSTSKSFSHKQLGRRMPPNELGMFWSQAPKLPLWWP